MEPSPSSPLSAVMASGVANNTVVAFITSISILPPEAGNSDADTGEGFCASAWMAAQTTRWLPCLDLSQLPVGPAFSGLSLLHIFLFTPCIKMEVSVMPNLTTFHLYHHQPGPLP